MLNFLCIESFDGSAKTFFEKIRDFHSGAVLEVSAGWPKLIFFFLALLMYLIMYHY